MAENQPTPSVGPAEDEDLQLLQKSKSKLWPLLLALVVLLGAAGAYLYVQAQRRIPLRVLVAINSDGYWWQGSPLSAELSDQLAEELKGLGFETINGGNPEVVDKIAKAVSPEEAAQLLKAGFVISGDLTPQVIELPVKSKYIEVRVAGDLNISYMGEPPASAGKVESWSGAGKKERALQLLNKNLTKLVFQRALAGLMSHKYIRTILEGENAVERGKLSKALSFVELRDQNVGLAEKEYTELYEKEAKSEGGGHDIRHHTKFRSEDLLCATGSHGFLVQRNRAEPFYNLEELSLGRLNGMEELVWVKHDGTEEPVTQAYNLFSYATAHPSGYPVVYIEDLYGWAKSVTVTHEDKSTERLRIDPDHRYLAPAVSVDKRLVAVTDRACQRCPNGLLVLDIKTKKERFALAGNKGRRGDFGFAGPSSLFYVFLPPAVEVEGKTTAPRLEIRQLDFSADQVSEKVFYTFEEGERVSDLSVGENGEWFVVLASLKTGRVALVFDAKTGKKTEYPAGYRVKGVHASPVARELVYESQGEIYHFDLVSQEETKMTRNYRRDRYPYFSEDGSRIYFEALSDDPNFKRLNVSSIASVRTP